HVEVYADAAPAIAAELGGDHRAPVTALGAVAFVAEPGHQLVPGDRDALHPPAGAGRFAGEPVAGQRRAHHVETALGQRADHLGELHHRTRPAVGDEDRERIGRAAPLVDEMNVQTADFGDVVVELVECRLAGAPVVVVGPVLGQFTGVGQRNALTPVVDALGLRPTGAGQ